MEYLRLYIRKILLSETTDPDFLKKVDGLWKQWVEVQEDIPTKTEIEPHFGYVYNEETDDHDQKWYDKEVTYQVTKGEDKPSYTGENPEHYDDRHSAERRVKYGQTKKEISVEKQLMTLWQSSADIEFLKSNKITYAHNVIYKSAARGMGTFGIEITTPSKDSWITAQNSKQKDAISVSGTYTPDGNPIVGSQSMMGRGWGFLIKGWPVFAAFTDLGSQTQRMASNKTKDFHASSGLPKRAGMPNAATKNLSDRKKRMRSRHLKRKGKSEEEIKEWFRVHANAVCLNEKDIQERGTSTIEEAILDNWTIDAWYIADIYQAKKFFIKALQENKITKPIYLIPNANMGDSTQEKYDPSNKDDVNELLSILKED